MMRQLGTILIFFLAGLNVYAQEPNWSEDIAEIFYTHCTECHHSGGIAPFSLIPYEGAYNHRYIIQAVVAAGIMPPWPPNPDYRTFAHQRQLTQEEVNKIVNWINSGALKGDTTLAPEPPIYNGRVSIKDPDLVLQIPDYTVNTQSDLYRCFVLPTHVPEGSYITAIEIVPGSRDAVHHVLMFQDKTDKPAELDAEDPGPGYTSFGGTSSLASKLVFGYTPGQGSYRLPEGMGLKLDKNTNIVLQIHYPGGLSNIVDSTRVLLKLAQGPMRDIHMQQAISYLGGQLTNGPLFIPANTKKTFYGKYTVPFDATLLGIFPHMHLIGRTAKAYGVTPDNDTIPLIDIPDWKFNWQGLYLYPRLLKIPAGTVIHTENLYDNTSANPYNPYDPPVDISFGVSTKDEMLIYYFAYTQYQAGDENIVIDSLVALDVEDVFQSEMVQSIQLFDPFPNPAREKVSFNYFIPNSYPSKVKLVDLKGKIIEEKVIPGRLYGYGTESFITSNLPTGVYIIMLENKGIVKEKKFIKQ